MYEIGRCSYIICIRLSVSTLSHQINMFDYVKHCYNGRYALGSVLRSWVPELVCIIDYQRHKVYYGLHTHKFIKIINNKPLSKSHQIRSEVQLFARLALIISQIKRLQLS
jgi:hypothetical protein